MERLCLLLDIGDVEVYTEIHGSGLNLLLVASLGGRHEFWKQQVPFLSQDSSMIKMGERVTLILLNLLRMGESLSVIVK